MAQSNTPGTIRTLTPEQVSSYKSQWVRYNKAVEIGNDAFTTMQGTGGITLVANYFQKSGLHTTDPWHTINIRQIGSENVSLLESDYAIQTGGTAKPIGVYRNVSDTDPKQIDGSYVVLNKDGQTIALITVTGSIIPVGDPRVVIEQIPSGTSVGYRCTCPDYSGEANYLQVRALGNLFQNWHTLGSIGACKHILAYRITRKELVSIPNDVPTTDEPRSRCELRLKMKKPTWG